MTYAKTSWIDGATPIDANNLNNIENGLQIADSASTSNATAIALKYNKADYTYGNNWRRSADGFLECWGYIAVSGNALVTFPKAFTELSTPQLSIQLTLCNSNPTTMILGFSVPTLTTVHIYTNTVTSLYVHWRALGR